jgi:hypothetical protein
MTQNLSVTGVDLRRGKIQDNNLDSNLVAVKVKNPSKLIT